MTFQSTKKGEQNHDPNTGLKNPMTPSLLKPPMVGDPRKGPMEALPSSGGSTPGSNTVASQNVLLTQVPPQRTSQSDAPSSNSLAPPQLESQAQAVPGTPTVTSPAEPAYAKSQVPT
ncbi:hypothetical protein B9Z65_1287 [Elsinoe australis]|uniref:Uncharacterized protein n=1 Tax=Elsinoe australis TaxID=40998 RepID=A0A2P7YQ83_9PEZI|nr:hypothetical protein B9Z65_1287 [Elsinoe australis]